MLLAATLRAKVTEKWAIEIAWITLDRMRFGQPLGSGSLWSAGMAVMKASGSWKTGDYGKRRFESKLAMIRSIQRIAGPPHPGAKHEEIPTRIQTPQKSR